MFDTQSNNTDSVKPFGGQPEQECATDNHPCYSENAHHRYARMHVPVAPACNIQCHYCNRKYDCSNESRPGITSQLLTAQQAVAKTLAVAKAIPQLAVVGIAGPGDPLANPKRTFDTLAGIAESAPELKLCLSTNGLALPQYVDKLLQYNVRHVTITINCIDPEIGTGIYPWIVWQGRKLKGADAVAQLIENQLQGLEMLVKAGVLVKVNSVLIPGVNARHLPAISKLIRSKGAALHNIVPLIARPEHGSFYGLNGQREPTADELSRVQALCGSETRIMRHCRQCRADAIGLLDEDRSAEFTVQKIDFMRPVSASPPGVNADRQPDESQRQLPLKIAVASSDGFTIDWHFGQARHFLIYNVSQNGVISCERRLVDGGCTGAGRCGDSVESLSGVVELLADCHGVLCAGVGYQPWSALQNRQITPNGEHAGQRIADVLPRFYRELYAICSEERKIVRLCANDG